MKTLVLLLSLVCASAFASAAPPPAPAKPAAPAAAPAAPAATPGALKTFTLRLTGEPETMDWNKAHTAIETYLLMNLMEGLVTFDSALKIIPEVAKEWNLSKDGKTYTFKLRPGVKWSDGVPLKAQDFVYSWKRLLSPLTAASYAYLLFDVEGAEAFATGKQKDFSQVGIKALDDQTFQVKLTKPVAHWIYIPTFWVTFPLREDVVEKHGTNWASPGRMVTLGPFTLQSHEHDAKIVMRANPTYYGKKPSIDEAICLIVKDDTTALDLYETGKIDFMTDIATLDLKRLAGRPDLRSFPYLKTGYMGMVTTKYPLSDTKVRRAIAMAIDKSKLGNILHGAQQPATSWIPPRMLAHSERVGLPFNPAKAKAELKASGVDMNRTWKFEMLLPNWDKPLLLSQYIQSELKKNLGFDVEIQAYDNKTFRAQVDLKSSPLFQLTWSADYPDPDNFMSVWLSNSGNNRTGWKNAKYDELVLQARGTIDAKSREAKYIAAQRMMLEDDAIIVPLYYEPNMALVRPRAKGVELNPLNYLILKHVTLQ